jgi:chlorobactene glucosyltransferase
MTIALVILALHVLFFLILIRNRFTFVGIARYGVEPIDQSKLINKKISILIPCRNEAAVVTQVLESALSQKFASFEIIVLDDHSEDTTFSLVERYTKLYPDKVFLHAGKERPKGWLGKTWACQQLGELATGDLLLFIDADTRLLPGMLRSVAAEFASQGSGMLTVWPDQLLQSWSEKLILPMVYHTLLAYLPHMYTKRDPYWLPKPFAAVFRPLFAAACGQCIAFDALLYRQMGGHHIAQNDIVEDVVLARKVRQLGYPVRMYHGLEAIQCRMYTRHEEIFQGFRKNFFAGFGYHYPLFVSAAIMHLVMYILPYPLFVWSWVHQEFSLSLVWGLAIGLPILERLILHQWMRWSPLWALTHLVGVLWFQVLGLRVVYDRLFSKGVYWKGRNIS